MRPFLSYVLTIVLISSSLALIPLDSTAKNCGRASPMLPSSRSVLSAPRKMISSSVLKAQGNPLLDIESQIFCNRELNGELIEAVGFDMDFTLVQYNEAFDLLAFDQAKQKLHSVLGYSEDVLAFTFDPHRFRRGLIIDKSRGNILKIDKHKYVRRVTHGLTDFSTEERKKAYMASSSQAPNFSDSNFVNIDTMFLLVDALLFAQLVDFKDRNRDRIDKSYEQLYKDVRQCVDICHRDGSIKNAVMREPEKYIVQDSGMLKMLLRYRAAQKKVFLLTNSLWDYTDVVMSYLISSASREIQGSSGPKKEADKEIGIDWKTLFDVIIVGASKPAFLTNEYLSLFEVCPDGKLYNIEDRDSLVLSTKTSIEGYGEGEAKPESHVNGIKLVKSRGRVFQGGYWNDLHRMLDIATGERILYVGDHMYADVLRSKKSLGWRTCLIIPELKHELTVGQQQAPLAEQIRKLQQLQYDLDEYLDVLRQRSKFGVDLESQLRDGTAKAAELKDSIRKLTDEHNSHFNSYWGQLFKAGFQDSRFAKQVVDYACLYTSRASNLGLIDPNRPFRPVQDFMPHEQISFDAEEENKG